MEGQEVAAEEPEPEPKAESEPEFSSILKSESPKSFSPSQADIPSVSTSVSAYNRWVMRNT